MKAMDLPDEVLEKALAFVSFVETVGPGPVHTMFAPWIRDYPDEAASVFLALAALADPDKVMKQGHASYVRGERGDVIVQLERKYQRQRKNHERANAAYRQQQGAT